jgi:hypothetical protein
VSASRRARRVAVAVGLAFVTACATARPPRAVPIDPHGERVATALDALRADAAARRGLRGVARVALDGPAGSGRAKQVIALERPSRLRVEVLGLFDQTVALLVTDGLRYRLVRDRDVDAGPVHDAVLYETTGLAVTPAEAVDVLLATPGAGAEAAVESAAALSDGTLRVVRRRAGGAVETLGFGADGRLRAWALGRAADAPLLEARFDDWRPLGAGAFPYEVALVDHRTGAEARVGWSSVELAQSLPDALFAPASGAAP